jgi:ribosome-binding protein aMBF1 (putative translation factor)
MSTQHERMVTRMRRESPDFGLEYDRLRALDAVIVPIILARKARGWSQRDLARAAGVQQPVIARLEVGDTQPTLGTLQKLGAALDLRLVMAPATTDAPAA